MRNLILLFVKYGNIFLFIALELLCLGLVAKYNSSQNEIFVNSANILSGNVYSGVNNFKQYFQLSATNDSLALENARLRKLLYNTEVKELARRDSIVDQDSMLQYSYVAAKVINNSINLNNNKITLNKGHTSGIKRRMGVIDANGIVGIVKEVSKKFSIVLSILHREVKISAAVKSKGFFGSMQWTGNDPNILDLTDISRHATVTIGDTIVTSGYSTKFPPNITLGVIDTFWLEDGNDSYAIKVKLNNDISNLQNVYVVDNLLAREQQEIEEATKNE
jgi:rod shape-determining protein MreC